MKSAARLVLNTLGLLFASPFILLALFGLHVLRSERFYFDAAYALAIIPGFAGFAVRRAFYWSVLPTSHWDLGIDFGSVITHPTTIVGRNIYIGTYSLIGRCHIGDNVQIGSRVSILSGRGQHKFHDTDNARFGEMRFQEILLGENSWVGEASVVMADLGKGCGVGAGSVVVHAVPDGTIVAGNPAQPIGVRGRPAD
jgi:acetyltransferase-like isoleucine patch superfamily enzyme